MRTSVVTQVSIRFHFLLWDLSSSCATADSPNCCSGSFDTPATCPSSGVEFYSYFSAFCFSLAYPSFISYSFILSSVHLLSALYYQSSLPRTFREQLSWLLCLCIRWIKRDCIVDMRVDPCGRLYGYFLSSSCLMSLRYENDKIWFKSQDLFFFYLWYLGTETSLLAIV